MSEPMAAVMASMVDAPRYVGDADVAWWRRALGNGDVSLSRGGARIARADAPGVPAELWPWRHGTPGEALEALVSRGLLPVDWCDPQRGPLWWHRRLSVRSACRFCENGVSRGGDACDRCGGRGWERDHLSPARAAPESRAQLAAVAGVGAAALSSSASLCASLPSAGWSRVVWVAAPLREAASMLYANARWMSDGDDAPLSLYGFAVSGGGSSLSSSVTGDPPLSTPASEAAWPALFRLWQNGTHPVDERAGAVALCVVPPAPTGARAGRRK